MIRKIFWTEKVLKNVELEKNIEKCCARKNIEKL